MLIRLYVYRERDPNKRHKKGRIYTDIGDSAKQPDGPMCEKDDCCKGREVDHKVHNKWFRAELKSAKALIRTLAPQIAEAVHSKGAYVNEDILANENASWSRYAGCSCPCSPGFVTEAFHGYNVSLTVLRDGAIYFIGWDRDDEKGTFQTWGYGKYNEAVDAFGIIDTGTIVTRAETEYRDGYRSEEYGGDLVKVG